jgi:predicted nucleotidyltransferase
MKQLKALLMVFSLVGCADVPRPDVDLCIINAKASYRHCYNLKEDYDSNGRLKPDAKAEFRDNRDITDLDKAFIVDSKEGFETGLARLKAYIKTLREEHKDCK